VGVGTRTEPGELAAVTAVRRAGGDVARECVGLGSAGTLVVWTERYRAPTPAATTAPITTVAEPRTAITRNDPDRLTSSVTSTRQR